MANIITDQGGEVIEQPQSSEVYERLKEPEKKGLLNTGSSEYKKVQLWKARIAVARKIRKDRLKDSKQLIRYYENLQWEGIDDLPILNDKTTINLIFANFKKELPNLYFQNPTPIVNPKRGEFALNAYAMQELLKFYTKFNMGIELKKHVRLAILDAKYAFGTLKVSYTPKFGVNPNANKAIIAGYNSFGEPLFLTDENNNIVAEPENIIVSELYYVERISPLEMLIDAECRNFINRAKWVGQEIVKPLNYLQNNKLYENTEFLSSNVELTEIFKDVFNKTTEEISAVKELDTDDSKQVRFVEIRDFENNELLVLPDGEDFFIREEPIVVKNTYSFLKFNESPDNFYPLPDWRIEKPLQREINIGQSQFITHMRRASRKYYYGPNTFAGEDEDKEIEKAKNPEDMSFFKISDYGQPPQPLETAQMDASIFQYFYQSRSNYNEVVGSTEMERGLVERRKTKGEAVFQEGHSAVRKGDKQGLVADFIVETYKNLAELMQHTLTVPQAIQIIGNTGIFWTEVNSKDIKGEFFYDIEISDMRPQIPEIDRQELSEFIFALSNILNSILANPIGQLIFNIQGLIKEFAKSYPSINVENILNGQITPQQIADAVMLQLQSGNNSNQGTVNNAGV